MFAIVVGGFLVLASNNVSKELSVIQPVVSQNDPYAGWKTYQNDQYGFLIRYPASSDLLIEEDGPLFINDFLSPHFVKLYIENTSFNDVQDWFNDHYKDRTAIMVPESDFIEVGGVDGLYVHDDPIGLGGLCESSIVFLKNKFEFRLSPYCESALQKQMVSSFKFVAQSDEATKQYTHQDLTTEETATSLVGFGTAYTQDGTNVYYEGNIIPGTGPMNLTNVGLGYSKDDHNVYYKNKVVWGADPQSFHVVENYRVGQIIFNPPALAQDRSSVWAYAYRIMDVGPNTEITILNHIDDVDDNVYFTDGTFAYVYTLRRGTKATVLKIKIPEDITVSTFDTQNDISVSLDCSKGGGLWWYFQTWQGGESGSNIHTEKVVGDPEDSGYCINY
jgi:hypothetical protein